MLCLFCIRRCTIIFWFMKLHPITFASFMISLDELCHVNRLNIPVKVVRPHLKISDSVVQNYFSFTMKMHRLTTMHMPPCIILASMSVWMSVCRSVTLSSSLTLLHVYFLTYFLLVIFRMFCTKFNSTPARL